jgi:uncharacterized membrane protein HdeD (DUF308 family)
VTDSAYRADVKSATSGWWLFAFVGLLSVVAGVIVLFKPSNSLATLAVIVGIFLLADGIIEIIASFLRYTPNRGLVALLGVVTAIIGVLLIRHPIAGVTAVALLIGIWLIAIGVIRLATAADEVGSVGWRVFVGIIELIAGIVIVAVPNIGYATLAILVGIGFILNGIGLLTFGFGVRGLRHEALRES